MLHVFQARRRRKGNNFFFTLSEGNSVCLLTQSWVLPCEGLKCLGAEMFPFGDRRWLMAKLSLKTYFWYLLPLSWEGEKRLCGFGGFFLLFAFFSRFFFSWVFFFPCIFFQAQWQKPFQMTFHPQPSSSALTGWEDQRVSTTITQTSQKHELRGGFTLRKADLPKSRVPGVTPSHIHHLPAVDEPNS